MAVPTKVQRTAAGYIYILRPRLSINGQNAIKIGMTTRTVAERVRELTTGSLVAFEVVYSLHVENARRLEKQLHARYQTRRLVAGGGQEFFSVSAEEVITEIERIATEISRARALSALHVEMSRFQNEIGASELEGRLSSWLGWLSFIGCIASGWFLSRAHPDTPGYVYFPILPIVFAICYEQLKKYFMKRFYEPRFRGAIDAKRQELKLKYPLAYP